MVQEINSQQDTPKGHTILGGLASISFRLASKHGLEIFLLGLAVYFTLDRFWFNDDAFIYFRYADNWVLHGFGLTYNQGEFVEGFTSPAWQLLVSFFRFLGGSYHSVVMYGAVISAALFSLLAIRVNDAFCPDAGLRVNFPLAYLCANYGMNRYFSSGLESPLVMLCAVGIALYVVRPKSRLALILTAMAPLVRHELILAVIVVALQNWIKERRFPRLLFLCTALPLLGWLVFRVYYYADFFPNTYHLKDGSNYARGLTYLWDTCNAYRLHWVLLGFIALGLILRRKKELSNRLTMLLAALAVTAYVVKVGGDYNHFRLLSLPFVLAAFSFGGLSEALLERLGTFRYPLMVAIPVCVVLLVVQVDIGKQRDFFGMVDRRWRGKRGLVPEKVQESDRFAQRFGKGRQETVFVHGWCLYGFRQSKDMMIHRFGLTDGILSRLDNLASEYAGHHWKMLSPAIDLMFLYVDGFNSLEVRRKRPKRITHPGRVGRIRHAARTRPVAPWIRENVAALEIIERKIYNKHQLWSNLKLAFQTPRIRYRRAGSYCQHEALGRREKADCRR